MEEQPVIWGVHMQNYAGNGPVDEGYIAIGWPELGDLQSVPGDREAFKAALISAYPDNKSGAIPVHAGMLYRFVYEMKARDIVVYPSKHDRMVNIGQFTGKIYHINDDPDEYPNRREVKWLGSFPRSDFSQSALNEIGSAMTLFRVKNNASEFLVRAGLVATRPGNSADDEVPDDDTTAVSVSKQAEETTDDFVIRRLMAGISGHEFEGFVAHLLECMGYTARVTQQSGDGGVDVIAHLDALGFQPPIIKVQCKRTAGQNGEPEVNQLLGTLGEGEYGLFINLGSYTRAAKLLERNRPKLRLIDGEEVVAMLLSNYGKLSPRYRALIPLKQIYVPDLHNT